MKVITEVLYELEAESWLNTRSLSYDRIRCILCTSHVFKINIVYIWKCITLLLGGVQFEELCGASPQHSYVVPVQRPIMSLAGRLDRAIADEHIGLYENRMQNKKNLPNQVFKVNFYCNILFIMTGLQNMKIC